MSKSFFRDIENFLSDIGYFADFVELLCGVIPQNYTKSEVFEDAELREDSVIRKFLITAPDGKKYNVNHYGLQMAIAVGFKVNEEAHA